MQGKTINGFTLQRLLGVGGMAEVWYAENNIGMKAAVKIISERLSHDEQMQERFLNEAKVMVLLDHPNIRKVYGFDQIDGRPAIVMEYLDGHDLKALLKQGRRFTHEELVKWWNQLVDALNYTHAQNIVHRDIKPSNIFIDQRNNVKLLDFGIAKVADTTTGTQTGSTLGTRIYMSPEQVRDPKRVGPPSDVYSLAVSFVHLLTGQVPYDSSTNSDYDIQESIVRKPLDLSKLPAEWKEFLEPYLEKDPKQRPPLRSYEASVHPSQPVSQPQQELKTQSDSLPVPTMIADDSTVTEAAKSDVIPSSDSNSSKTKSRKGLWIVLGLVVAVTALFFIFNHDNDTKTFETCQTVKDYRSYIASYGSEAEHYSEEKKFIDDFVADSTAKAVQRSEEEAYDRSMTVEGCEEYLKEYPNGRYVVEVQAKKAELEAEMKEDEMFKKCSSIAKCNSYLKEYPQGRYVIEVQKKKAEFEQQAKEEADRLQEEAVYQQCTTVSACERYLSAYPQGRYAVQVMDKKNQLEKLLPSIKGAFSVSSTECVFFAKGNLQYQPSTGKWRFAEHQWDFLGGANNFSPSNSGWMDLFCWGTGDDPTKTGHYGTYYASFTDWGKICGDSWRTLSNDEWKYVFNDRNTRSGVRYALAEVNGVMGIILLPDDWDDLTIKLNNTNKLDYSTYYHHGNTISASDWNSRLAPSGAIFLPAAGWGSGESVSHAGEYGSYWSSTIGSSNASAYHVTISHYPKVDDISGRHSGSSVRLVRPAK